MSKLQRYQLVEDRPSRIQRLREAVEAFRSHWSGPLTSSSPEIARLWGAPVVSSGVSVNESTALNYSAVWAAVSLISSQVGNLPLVLYKKDGKSKERFDAHPLYRLVHDRPNPEMSAFTFRETLQGHVLTWGNNYAEIERNGMGRPAALWPITPDRVTPFRRSADSPLQYRVSNPDGGEVFFPAADMLHVPGLGYDGSSGYSVIAKARESLGLGIATERFGGSFFGNGATFGGVIAYKGPRPTELSDKNYRETLEAKHQGVDRAHKLLALYNDATYTRMGIPPNDAQFLETRTFQIDEVARWFNLPPHKLKELMRSTNNNIEQQNLEYYIDCLAPWLERWEQELCEKLIAPSERNRQEIEFVADGLLRGDSAGRGEFHSKQFNTASITPNEIRAIENRNPLPGGDRAFVALNMVALDRYDEWLDAEIKSKNPPPPPAPVASPAPASDPAAARALEQAIDDRDAARKKAQDEEELRDLALADVQAITAARDEAVRSLQAAQQRIELIETDYQRVCAEKTAVETQRDGLAGTLQIAEAVAAELRTQVTTLTGERDQERTEHANARDARARVEASLELAETAKLALEATVQQQAITERTRLGAVAAAHRGLIADAMGRMVRRETEKARRNQGTAAKLRAWAESFYLLHEDMCVDALLPAVRTHLAWIGSDGDPESLTRDFLRPQLAAAVQMIRNIADGDPEDYQPLLERVLTKWEQDRPDALADLVLQKGIDHVRSL